MVHENELRQLIADAQAATAGGIRTVPERILQHRDLLLSVVKLVDRSDKINEALQDLWKSIKRFPAYGESAEAISHTWGVRNAKDFNEAIERLHRLCPDISQ